MKYLTTDERQTLEKFCWDRAATDARNATMILLTMATGLRAQELLNLTRTDFNVPRCIVSIKTLKRGKRRELPISKALMGLITTLFSLDEPKVFPISYQRLNQIWNQWRPLIITFHGLRHTFAMRAFERAEINEVQYMLGHRSMQSTGVYLEVEPTEKRMKQVLGVR